MKDANTRLITACCFQNLHEKKVSESDRNDAGTFSLVALRGQHVKACVSCVHGGFPPRVFTWYSRMSFTYLSDCSGKLLPPQCCRCLLIQHHADTDHTMTRLHDMSWTGTFGISRHKIQSKAPFTFMWLMSRVFKAAHSILKLYYHRLPWKHGW